MVSSRLPVLIRLRILGGLSAIQGVFFLVYAVLVVIGVARLGISGPSEVANAPGVILEVVIFLVFGLGMLAVSLGWFTSKRWARAPFLLAQLLALVVSIPITGATDSFQRTLAILATLTCGLGIILAFTPRVTHHLLLSESPSQSH